MIYPQTAGALCARMSRGFNGQDAWTATVVIGTEQTPLERSPQGTQGGQRMPDKENFQAVVQAADPPRKYIVRRLTPLECCRLQGFPDWWTEGVEGSDSAQYKMWGNGIALPCAVDVLRRIAKEMEANETDHM